MDYPEITHLYKYTTTVERVRQMVEEEKIWYSKISSFNDPFEGIFDIDRDMAPEDVIALAVKYFSAEECNWSIISKKITSSVLQDDFGGLPIRDEFLEKIEKSVDSLASSSKDIGVLSLSESPLNILMWSHYSNEHKGFCVEFKRTIDDPLGNNKLCRPVVYSKSYPTPSIRDVLMGNHALTDKMVYTKSIDWAYEKEWRVTNNEGNVMHSIPGAITGIILGAKWDGDLDEVQDLAMDNGVTLYRAKIDSGKYSLSLHEVQ